MKALITLFIILGLTGCGGEADLVTYNVGLARGFVSYADERVEPVSQAVAGLEADALCIQEAWLREDEEGNWNTDYIDAIKSASSERFPHVYWERTKNEGAATSCTLEEAAELQTCAETYCPDVSPGELADCALEYCGDLFNASSAGCQSCIAANIGNSIEVILDRCVGGSGSAAYDGHNGLMLMSQTEPLETNHVQFTSALTTRSALHAQIKLPGLGKTDLFCTHLAADLSGILTYPGTEFGSFVEEQKYQIEALLEFVDQHSSTGQAIIMGDFNTGPDDIEENYQLLGDAGFSNPYVEANGDALCTYCGENSLNGGTGGVTIDHVMPRFPISASQSSRLFDETVSITAEEGELSSHLSDHYGVRLIIEQ